MTAPALPLLWLPRPASGDGGGALGDPRARAAQSDPERDARLVTAALEDADAYRHLVQLYQHRVYATALRMLGEPADAHDVAQEAFLRAFRALHRFEAGRPFGPWICTIAANVARDRLRDPLRRIKRMSAALLEREPAPSRADTVEQEQTRDAMAEALLQLKPKIREALVLRFVSDLSVDEVADALGIGQSAAKMRLKRGIEQLRELLDDDDRLA